MATKVDELQMREALKEAERAFAAKERPVGAVIVHRAHPIGRAHHQMKTLRDPTAHAAMIAITQAATALPVEQLKSATLYVTEEPCCMCVGAVLLSGIGRLVIGSDDPRQGACGSVIDVPGNDRLNRRMVIVRGVLAAESAALLRKSLAGVKAS